MLTVIYNGVDITSRVSIRKCWHDMYAKGRSDELFLKFNDPMRLWDRWQPSSGDRIEIRSGTISSGEMYIARTLPENGAFSVWAQSMPISAQDKRGKTWQGVRFLQLCREVADRQGLSLETYGVEDHLYAYVMQSGEGDFSFLHKRCALEGCAFLVYSGKLVVYNEAYLEQAEPGETLRILSDTDFRYTDDKAMLYGSCVVTIGPYTGTASVSNGSYREYAPSVDAGVSSQEEADRFAANLLRGANQMARCGYIRFPILAGYAAGSTARLENDRAPSYNGKVFLTHVRNDYAAGSCIVYFRRLEV